MRIALGYDQAGSELGLSLLDRKWSNAEIYPLPLAIDYPLVAAAVVDSLERADTERGVVICGSGNGVAIAANKFFGVRCSLVASPSEAVTAVQTGNVQVIALNGTMTSATAHATIEAFAAAAYEPTERSERRLEQLQKIELGEDLEYPAD